MGVYGMESIMHLRVSMRRPGRIATVLACLFAAGLTACTAMPDSGRPPSTPYKGDAVWNVASTGPGPHRIPVVDPESSSSII
jgi:hypothetical protein